MLKTKVSCFVGLCLLLVFLTVGCSDSSSKDSREKYEKKAEDAVHALEEHNTLAFNPSTPVLPFPNDVPWLLGMLPPDPATATGEDQITILYYKALYTAIGKLGIEGLSPNTPLTIPLENSIKLTQNSMEAKIEFINLSRLMGVLYLTLGLGNPFADEPDVIISSVTETLAGLDADGWANVLATTSNPTFASMIHHSKTQVRVVQDGSMIKIYPLKPFEADMRYVCVIKEGIHDTNGQPLHAPSYYLALKSEEPLTGTLTSLEALRLAYAPVYNLYLPAVGISKEETAEIFTFTIAAKTLSISDFMNVRGAVVSALVAGSDDIDAQAMTINGLSYKNADFNTNNQYDIASEYGAFNAAAQKMVNGTGVNAVNGSFASFDITTLAADAPTGTNVPYETYNSALYTGKIVIFQHGLGGDKTHAQLLMAAGLNLPVIAMDLPLHGDRAIEGEAYLSKEMDGSRVNLYQSSFDQTILLKNLRAGLFDLDQDGNTNTLGAEVVDTDDIPERIFFYGISAGAITGSVFNAYNTIDKVVLNVGGANFAALADTASNAEITDIFGAGAQDLTSNIQLGVLQTLIDPADPVFLANADYNGKVVNNPTILQTAYGDTVTSNISNEILANAVGYTRAMRTNIIDPDAFDANNAANFSSGWYQFGSSEKWVHHSFALMPDAISEEELKALYFPEAADHLDVNYIRKAKTKAMQQVINFFQ